MRTIKTLAGTTIDLDGDALQVIETISRDLTRRHELAYSFEDVDREIQHVIDQMQDDELRMYLKESLFMSFNRYENDRMLAIVKRASLATPARAKGTGQRAQRRAEGKGQRAQGKAEDRGQRAGSKGQRSKATPRAKGLGARGSKRGRRT